MKNDNIEEWGVSPTWKPNVDIENKTKENPVKPSQGQVRPRQASQGQARPVQANQGQARPAQANQGQARPGQANQGQARPGQASQGQARPVQANQGQVRPAQANQGQARPVQANQGQARPAQTSQGQARPAQASQGQAKPRPIQSQTKQRQGQASNNTFMDGNSPILAAMKKDLMVSSRTVQGNDYEMYHIGVLDGIRAISIIIIVWFHFWQQSWIMPVFGPINLDWLPRNGSILVDMMILLSGFCLFLPYARHAIYGEQRPSSGLFYTKRASRIFPSYFVAIAIALVIALVSGTYVTNIDMLRDLLPHLVFLHNWFVESSSDTQLIGVLWTVAVEVQFYIFFPMLAKSFIKKPMLTYWIMVAVGVISSFIISVNFANVNQSMFVNNTFTFASVYANGMLGAWVYVYMTKRQKKNRAEQIFFTLMSLASIFIYKVLCEHRMNYSMETKWQLDYRYVLSLVFLLFVVSTIMALKWYRIIWDNIVMRFIASISFNLYICHQFIAVKLKEWRIPYWTGDEPPNIKGDSVWQWEYLLLSILLSLVVAVAMTYLVEKPLANLIKKIYRANHSE